MYSIKTSEVRVGSIIAEPILRDGVTLINSGIPVSKVIKNSLMRLGIHEIKIEGILGQKIDLSKLRFGELDNLLYLAIRKLDLSHILECAEMLVKNTSEDKDYALLNVLMDKDEDTYIHSFNVACFAVTFGIYLNLSIKELETLTVGCLLHDIGKIYIPDAIITKEGKLTDEEYAIIKRHPIEGYEMLKKSDTVTPAILQIIKQHHENFDGSGYPYGLQGFKSYKFARVVHICDVYEALCAKRSYKSQLPRYIVWQIMDGGVGSQFDPLLYRKFKEMMPTYFIGEEVLLNGSIGTVVDSGSEIDNPLIYIGNSVHKLKSYIKENNIDFESVKFNINFT